MGSQVQKKNARPVKSSWEGRDLRIRSGNKLMFYLKPFGKFDLVRRPPSPDHTIHCTLENEAHFKKATIHCGIDHFYIAVGFLVGQVTVTAFYKSGATVI